MTDINLEKLLSIYDTIDQSKEANRIKVRILFDYYGGTLTQVNRDYIGLDGIHGNFIKSQWGQIKPRLESASNFIVPDKFEGMISELQGYRSDVAHNYLYFPPQNNVAQIREKAESWYSWLREEAGKYQEWKQSLTAKEALEELIEENLKSILWLDLNSRNSELVKEDYEKLKEKSKDKLNTLEKLKDKERITTEHIELLESSLFYHGKSKDISDELAEIGEFLYKERAKEEMYELRYEEEKLEGRFG